jgi:chemotaxis protein CheX
MCAQGRGCGVRIVKPGRPLGELGNAPGGFAVFIDDHSDGQSTLTWAVEQASFYGAVVVAVTGPDDADDLASLKAVGVDMVCGPSVSDEEIVERMARNRSAQPVPIALRTELLDPFCEAAVIALREMAAVEVVVHAVYRRPMPLGCGDITAVIRLSFCAPGFLALSMPQRTASLFASRIFGPEQDQKTIDDSTRDCVGEMTNVIAGQAKALLARSRFHFVFSTPAITLGPIPPKAEAGMDCFVIVFGSECGDFALQVGLGHDVGAH